MRIPKGPLQTTALRYFCEVVERGSVHAASSSLLVAASAISRQVRLLERDLDVQLFDRQQDGMAVTPAGRALYEYAGRVHDEEAALRRVLAEGQQFAGVFSLASVEGVLAPLAGWVEELRRAYPNVVLDVSSLPATEVEKEVLGGGVDIGFVFGRAARAGIAQLAEWPVPIQLVVPRDHELAGRSQVSVTDLDGRQIVLPHQTFAIRREVERACVEHGVTLQAVCETNSLLFALELVNTLPAVTVSTASMVRTFRHADDVAVIDIDHSRLRATRVTMVCKHGATTGPVVAELRRFFQAKMDTTVL